MKKERTEEEFNFILENLKKYKILEDCKKRADYFSNVSSDSLNMFANNDLVKKVLKWSYKIKLKDGLKKTYNWISAEINNQGSNLSRFTKS